MGTHFANLPGSLFFHAIWTSFTLKYISMELQNVLHERWPCFNEFERFPYLCSHKESFLFFVQDEDSMISEVNWLALCFVGEMERASSPCNLAPVYGLLKVCTLWSHGVSKFKVDIVICILQIKHKTLFDKGCTIKEQGQIFIPDAICKI